MKIVEYIKEPPENADIINYTVPGWYFWDEWYHLHGPFDTEKETEQMLVKYLNHLNKPNERFTNESL